MSQKYLFSFLALMATCGILSAQSTAPLTTPSTQLPPPPDSTVTNASPAQTTTQVIKKEEIEVSQEANAKVGFVYSAPLRQGGTKIGETDEVNTSFSYVASPRIDKDFLLRTGFSYDYLGTGKSPYNGNFIPIPDTLQSTAAIIGFDMIISDDWLLRFEAAPGIYSDFQSVDAGAFNIPFNVGASWLVNPDFQLIVGGGFNMWNEIPFIPVVGCRWQFADSWTLMAMAPNPRVTYKVNEAVSAYAGASLSGGSYRVGKNFGDQNGRPDLDNALVQVMEVRIGPGIEWKATPFLNVDFDGGVMAYRNYDYYRDHLSYHNSPAPYMQVSVGGNF